MPAMTSNSATVAIRSIVEGSGATATGSGADTPTFELIVADGGSLAAMYADGAVVDGPETIYAQYGGQV